jgi:hypothetical protein
LTGKVFNMTVQAQVSRDFNAILAFSASLLLCILPGSDAFAAPIELADILEIDALGYRCVPSVYFDDGEDGSTAIAFSLSGKTRLPRTCLPDPCARALTQQELSSITGTEPMLARFHNEWDDYYSRYADHCRREVVVSRPRSADAPNRGFWSTIIDRARVIQQIGLPTSSRLRPFVFDQLANPETDRAAPRLATFLIPRPAGQSFLNPDRPIPSPVPLPASGLTLGLTIGAATFARRRRKSKPIVCNST